MVVGWPHTRNKNKSMFNIEKIPITISMDALFDQINRRLTRTMSNSRKISNKPVTI